MRRVRFTTTAGLVNELVEASSRRVTFPGGSVRESWAPPAQASCGTAQGNRGWLRAGRSHLRNSLAAFGETEKHLSDSQNRPPGGLIEAGSASCAHFSTT